MNAMPQFLLVVVVSLTATCLAAENSGKEIDALTASPANFALLLENEHVRVLEYVLLPGEQDKWHTHPPKVSYVLTGGTLEIHLDDGTMFVADEKSGQVPRDGGVGFEREPQFLKARLCPALRSRVGIDQR